MLTLLDSTDPGEPFPDPGQALRDPDGLLAVGGCLTSTRLINAYRNGIFPWFNEGNPILWWSPDPRLVLRPEQIHLRRSLKKVLRRQPYTISFDRDFEQVIRACAAPRQQTAESWITESMISAFNNLNRLGIAHSVESWQGTRLAGGLYGVAIGRVFFGESMFFREANASKVAFAHLVEKLGAWGFELIDCQVHTSHLQSFGASNIPRSEFIDELQRLCVLDVSAQAWKAE